LDVGTIYKLPVPSIETNVGLVIKNLIEPQFDFPSTDEKLTFQRQLTLGVSSKLYKVLTLAVDYDLNKTKTLVDGYDIQNFSVGLEINPPILPVLRLGYLKNLAMDNDQLYTIGLGIKILVLNFDLVCAFNTQETKINKDLTLPTNNLSLGITLGMKF
ncbi:MAG: conjugal transfer protein TraF, partial [Endomicrobiia bacterium]